MVEVAVEKCATSLSNPQYIHILDYIVQGLKTKLGDLQIPKKCRRCFGLFKGT